MAQTELDQTAVRSLLADNASNAISPQDIRDALASAMGYGGLALSFGGAPASMLGVGTGYDLVDVFDTIRAESLSVNLSGTDARLGPDYSFIVNSAGFYHVDFYASFSLTANNKLVTFGPHLNNVADLQEVDQFVSNGPDVATVALSGIIQLSAADEVDMRVKIDSGTSDISFRAAAASIHRVG
jgi:hypothetical protein